MIDEIKFKAQIADLPLEHRIAFGASVCERLMPNYLAFSEVENFGDYKQLKNVLNDIWSGLIGYKESKERVKMTSFESLIELAPDTEDFHSIYTSMAGNTVSAIVYTIEALLNPQKSIENIVCVARLAVESLYEYEIFAQTDNSSAVTNETHNQVMNSLSIKSELEKQEQSISFLEKHSILDAEVCKQLKVGNNNT